MNKPMPDFVFRIMSFILKCRDTYRPREIILQEVGIQPKWTVLDFGCGPGSYVAAVSRLVGEQGKIYALDIHPLATEKVKSTASRLGLSNVQTISSGCATGLPDKSVDAVLLYDIYHMIGEKTKVLTELHRVLRDDGILSFSDHHMKEKDILSGVQGSGLFKLGKADRRTYTFTKQR